MNALVINCALGMSSPMNLLPTHCPVISTQMSYCPVGVFRIHRNSWHHTHCFRHDQFSLGLLTSHALFPPQSIFIPSPSFVVPESPLVTEAIVEVAPGLGHTLFGQSHQVWCMQLSLSGIQRLGPGGHVVGSWAVAGYATQFGKLGICSCTHGSQVGTSSPACKEVGSQLEAVDFSTNKILTCKLNYTIFFEYSCLILNFTCTYCQPPTNDSPT